MEQNGWNPPEKSPFISRRTLLAVGLVLMLAVGVLSILIGINVVAGEQSAPTSTPGGSTGPTITLLPLVAAPGTTIAVDGGGWRPGDNVFIRLGGPGTTEEPPAAIASATVGADGRFTATFVLPADPLSADQGRVLITAWAPASGDETFAVLLLAGAGETATALPTTPPPSPTATAVPATATPLPSTATSPAPTPTPTPIVNAWHGEYYGNRDLLGTPLLVRDDAAVNFDWATGAPSAGVPADGFSARWTRTLNLINGTYRFAVLSDDGVRVWLDGQLLIDQWHDAAGTTYSAERAVTAGSHTLRVEYYENSGQARIRFWWEQSGEFPQWRGEYYANLTLVGAPLIVRNDANIDFNWGFGAPVLGMPADNFSARWTRVMAFEEGVYRFRAVVDDGVRVYLDDALLIDSWTDGGQRELTRDQRITAGNHSLRVEYYEHNGAAVARVGWETLTLYPDWKAEYWSNRTLNGSPTLVRNDANIDFNWGINAPAAGLPHDDFSVRWTRRASFNGGTYRFHVVMDDGARLWVDDNLVIDSWQDGSPRELTTDYGLVQGEHSLRVEYYERAVTAQVRVWWEAVAAPTFPDWKGEYWSNPRLDGSPALVRNDRELRFHWENGAPAVGLPADNFSARWSRVVTFEPGVYRFYAWVDDGVRIYIDGTLLMDEWHDNGADEVYIENRSMNGAHQIVVEYYEHGDQAQAQVWWNRYGDMPTAVPTATPTSVPPTATTTGVPPTPTKTRVPPTATTTGVPPTATSTGVPPTATSTGIPPTATNTPTALPVTMSVRINEVLPMPLEIDWNGDGTADEQDEWIELVNNSSQPVNVASWYLATVVDADFPYRIPRGTVIQPFSVTVFYCADMGLAIDDEQDTLRLIDAQGQVVDTVQVPGLLPDTSYSWDPASEEWRSDWAPSPGTPNGAAAAEPVLLLGAEEGTAAPTATATPPPPTPQPFSFIDWLRSLFNW